MGKLIRASINFITRSISAYFPLAPLVLIMPSNMKTTSALLPSNLEKVLGNTV